MNILHLHIHLWAWCLGIDSHIQHIWCWLLVASSHSSEAYNINLTDEDAATVAASLHTRNNTFISYEEANVCGHSKAAQLPWIQHQVFAHIIFGGYYSSSESSYRLEVTTADGCSPYSYLDWYAPQTYTTKLWWLTHAPSNLSHLKVRLGV